MTAGQAFVSLPRASHEDSSRRLAFVAQLLERLRATPGVEQAGASMGVPFSGGSTGEYVQRPGSGGDEGQALGR